MSTYHPFALKCVFVLPVVAHTRRRNTFCAHIHEIIVYLVCVCVPMEVGTRSHSLTTKIQIANILPASCTSAIRSSKKLSPVYQIPPNKSSYSYIIIPEFRQFRHFEVIVQISSAIYRILRLGPGRCSIIIKKCYWSFNYTPHHSI